MSLTLKEYIEGVKSGTLDAKSVISAYREKAKAHVGKGTNAFITLTEEYIDNNMDRAIA